MLFLNLAMVPFLKKLKIGFEFPKKKGEPWNGSKKLIKQTKFCVSIIIYLRKFYKNNKFYTYNQIPIFLRWNQIIE